MSELDEAIKFANKMLDRINADPDDDLAILARQFLKAEYERDEMEKRCTYWRGLSLENDERAQLVHFLHKLPHLDRR